MPLGSTLRSPHAFTTLPAVSNSITGAAGTESRVSGELTRFPRVTMNTWSRESTQVPATSPVDHGLGLPVDVLSTSGVPKSPALGNGILGHGQSYGTGVNIMLSSHDGLLVVFVIQCGVNGTQDRSFWLFPRFANARYAAACPWECTEQVVLRLLSYGNPTGSRITDSIAQARAKIMLGRAPISVKPKPPPLRLISELELTVAVHNSSELHVRNMWG